MELILGVVLAAAALVGLAVAIVARRLAKVFPEARPALIADGRAFTSAQVMGFMTIIGAIIGALILLKFGAGIYYTVGDTLPTPSDPNATAVIQQVDDTAKTVFTTAPLAPYAWVIGVIMTALFGAFLIFRG